jgi:hypothetical protein
MCYAQFTRIHVHKDSIREVEYLGGIDESKILMEKSKDIKKWTNTILLSFYRKRTLKQFK